MAKQIPERKLKSRRSGTQLKPPEAKDEAALLEVSARAQAIDAAIIELSFEQQEELALYLDRRLAAALGSAEWTETYSRIDRMREQYEKGVPRTEIPIQGAHDYRSQLAASATDGMRSRLIGVFATDPIIRLEGRNEEGVRNQVIAEKWLDYHHDVNVKLPTKGEQLVSYCSIEGHAVIYAPWRLVIEPESLQLRTKRVYVNKAAERLVDVNNPAEVSKAQSDGFVPKEPEEFRVYEFEGPEVLKNYPDMEVRSLKDYICPAGSKPGLRPLWEAVTEKFTLDDLMRLEGERRLYPGVVKKIKKHLKNYPDVETPGAAPQAGISSTDKETDENISSPHEKEALDASLECRMFFGRFKIPGRKFLESAVIAYHAPSRTVLFAKFNRTIGRLVPIFQTRLIQVPFRFAGIGCMELSVLGERTINDLVNYVLDETRIFSSIPFKRKQTVPPLNPFDFWKGITVKNMNDVEFPNIPDRRMVDLNVATYIRANTERRSGIGDLQLGRESDVTGKQPPTARGTMSIIREGAVRFGLLNFSFIAELCEWASYEMKMFQQLIGRKTVVEAVGEDGKELFPDGLSRTQIMGAFRFIPNTNAQSLVRELDLEINMMLYNTLSANKLVAGDLGALYELTNDIWLSAGKKKKLLQPLSVMRKILGLPDPKEQMLDLTPVEQEYAQVLLQEGVPPEAVKQKITEMRAGAAAGTAAEEPGAIPDEDVAAMLTGQAEAE